MLVEHVEQEHNRAPHERLSDREFRVLCLIGSGFSVKEIAAQLSLSSKSISTFRSRLLKKLRLSNNADIMRYVWKHALVDIDRPANGFSDSPTS